MSFLNVYFITLCRLHEKNLILNEVKNWQMCYSRMVTFVVVHYIADLPTMLVLYFATIWLQMHCPQILYNIHIFEMGVEHDNQHVMNLGKIVSSRNANNGDIIHMIDVIIFNLNSCNSKSILTNQQLI
jgi:hypothetical protein